MERASRTVRSTFTGAREIRRVLQEEELDLIGLLVRKSMVTLARFISLQQGMEGSPEGLTQE